MSRDHEQQRTYDAEAAALHGSVFDDLVSLDELTHLTASVTASAFWRQEAAGREVTVRLARSDAHRSSAQVLTGEIRIARPQLTVVTLLHELAHLAAGPLAGHNARFRACHIALWRVAGHDAVADRLSQRYSAGALAVESLAAAPDAALVRKVAALLDKAASTTFEPEADALRAKAAVLTARHRLDAAAVAGARVGGDTTDIVTASIYFDAGPYISARMDLLGVFVHAYGCRGVVGGTTSGRHYEVIGHPDDVSVVLATYSAHATRAALEMLAARPTGNTTAWRRSFLYGYASKIREDVRVAAPVTHAADAAALVLLRARESRAEAYIAQRYGRLGRARGGSALTDYSGFVAGVQAAAGSATPGLGHRRALAAG